MWIETLRTPARLRPGENSFASNGECGLKLSAPHPSAQVLTNSFASNGECGLKQIQRLAARGPGREFIRQQWRMWIETLVRTNRSSCMRKFIRQQWRMWIETGGVVAD